MAAKGTVGAPTCSLNDAIYVSRYVNDDRNEIKSELNPDQQDSEWMGVPILSESISWEPSIDEMCDDYDLNEEACEFDVGSRERERARFTFELICKVEQGNLYQSDNDKQEAGVSG